MGKEIPQPHQLLGEFEAIPGISRKKLTDGPFGEIFKSTSENRR